MDLRLPGDATAPTRRRQILAARPPTCASSCSRRTRRTAKMLRAIEAGAVGYLLKDVPHDELFRALRAVARGERYLAPGGEQAPARAVATAGVGSTLTDRERDVLRCRGARRWPIRQIAAVARHRRADGQGAPRSHLRKARRRESHRRLSRRSRARTDFVRLPPPPPSVKRRR